MNIKKRVIDYHKSIGYDVDSKGYVTSPEVNLIAKFPNWEIIKNEVKNGDGNELSRKKGRINFHAVHSSCALCVNHFAMVKHHKNNISLFESPAFDEAIFEKKLSTGISTPNLDFYLKNDAKVIGIESKFTEVLTPALPNKEKNLDKYLTAKLNFPTRFNDVIEHYRNCDKMYLNVAQLLKHMMGMFNETSNVNKGAKVCLVYLYWVPSNWKYIKIYQEHEKELEAFKKQISGFPVEFEAYSYIEFWKNLERNEVLKEYVDKIKDRYWFPVY